MSSSATAVLTDLGFVAQLRGGRLAHRLIQLALGLIAYGLSVALMIRSDLGAAPWDVFHTGVAEHLPVTVGRATVLTSLAILVIWVALRERIGLGTLANAVVVGLSADVFLAIFDTPGARWARGCAAGGRHRGQCAGDRRLRGHAARTRPRDGLMTGIARRTGRSIRLVRTTLEVVVIVAGAALGGAIGFGTVAYALAIGPLAQSMIPVFAVRLRAVSTAVSPAAAWVAPDQPRRSASG